MIQITKGQQFPVELSVMRTQDTVTTQFLLAGFIDLCFNAVGKQRQYALQGFTYKDNRLSATVNTVDLDPGVYTLTARGRYMGEWWRAVTVPLFEVVEQGGVLPTEPVTAQSTAVFSIHQELTGALARIDALEQGGGGGTPAIESLEQTPIEQITAAQYLHWAQIRIMSQAYYLVDTCKTDTSGKVFSDGYSNTYYDKYAALCDYDSKETLKYAMYESAFDNSMLTDGEVIAPPNGTWNDTSSGKPSSCESFSTGYKLYTASKSAKLLQIQQPSHAGKLHWLPYYVPNWYGWEYKYDSMMEEWRKQYWDFPALQVIDMGEGDYEGIEFEKYDRGLPSELAVILCPGMSTAKKQELLDSMQYPSTMQIMGNCLLRKDLLV